MKKFIALVLAVLMLASLAIVPATAYKSYHAAAKDFNNIKDGDLIYYQGFNIADVAFPEGGDPMVDNNPLAESLGWRILNQADGALTDYKTKLSIVNGRLKCDSLENGGDSYCYILDDDAMWEIANYGQYTMQYDIEYEEDITESHDRYCALILNYNGGDTYNSFHFRTNGSANNQCRVDSSWYTYDVAGDFAANGKDDGTSSSPVFKITNGTATYDKETGPLVEHKLNMTIRYQVDLEADGPVIWVRNNNLENAEFVCVSKGDYFGQGSIYWQNFDAMDSFAFALKSTKKCIAYIDNIYLYAGLGDTPAATASAYVPSSREGIVIRNAASEYGGVSYIGCQSAVGENSMAIRFIGGIDSKKYNEVGFTIKMTDSTGEVDKSTSTRNVYNAINYKAADGTASEFYAPDSRFDCANYMFTVTLDGIPKTGTVTFEITAYSVNFENVRTEADTYIVTYTDGVLVSQQYKQ